MIEMMIRTMIDMMVTMIEVLLVRTSLSKCLFMRSRMSSSGEEDEDDDEEEGHSLRLSTMRIASESTPNKLAAELLK